MINRLTKLIMDSQHHSTRVVGALCVAPRFSMPRIWYTECMANQQLVDYITQQTQAGVTKEVVKNALVTTGWGERDVADAMNAAFGTSPAAVAPVASPAAVSPAVSRPTIAAKPAVTPVVMPAAKPIVASPAAASSLVSVSMFDAKSGPVFEPKSKSIQSGTPPTSSVASSGSVIAIAAQRSGNRFTSIFLPVILGVVTVGAGVFAYMTWREKSGLREQVAALTAQSAALQAQLQGLEKDKDADVSHITALTESANDFEGQLSLFVVPGGSSAAVSVTVKGTVNGSDKVPYTLTTGKGIVLAIKNYKDPTVFPLLPSFVGEIIEITGTHVPGARDITVTALNGKPIATPTTP